MKRLETIPARQCWKTLPHVNYAFLVKQFDYFASSFDWRLGASKNWFKGIWIKHQRHSSYTSGTYHSSKL